MDVKKELNKEQKQALTADGDVLIIAGPGTGKTRTLTSKIVHLLDQGIAPENIVALTFTKKAASEMRERVNSQTKNTDPPFIGTFHSLAYEILNKNGFELEIATEKELAEIMREICGNYSGLCKKLGKNNFPRYISLYKTGDISDFDDLEELVTNYNSLLKKRGLMDYDDLLIKTLLTMQDQKIKYKKVLIDEFQDTNNLQYQLIKQMLGKKGDLFVIGDPKQSIYAFRGSNEEIFEDFKQDFPEAKEVVLSTNYRSGKSIIEASSTLFNDLIKLKPKNEDMGSVKLVETYNQYSEADWILKEINEKVGGIDLNYAAEVDIDKQTSSFADFAIVYRIHSLNRVIEKKFYEFGIPFQIVGGQSLYEQKEIKFIITALKYIENNQDKEVLLKKMRDVGAVEAPISLIKERLKSVEKNKKISMVVGQIVEKFGFEDVLEGKNIKLQNLKEFLSSTIQFDKHQRGLSDFLNNIKYLEEHEYYDDRADKVTLMSMHAAKGLEFPFVYIMAFEQGIIPYKKSIEEEKMEEEKRLLYVAMTRAENELQLIHAQRRYGKRSEISKFANDFSKTKIKRIKDPQIEKIKKRIEKNKKKQLDLF